MLSLSGCLDQRLGIRRDHGFDLLLECHFVEGGHLSVVGGEAQDETADLDLAGREIVRGASFDNNMVCTDEKETFVVESHADELLRAMDRGSVAHAIMDTWEGEPDFRSDLLERVFIASPHIAGHSYEGKYMGTVLVYREACRFLGVAPTWTVDASLPPPLVPRLAATPYSAPDAALWKLVHAVYDIEADDARMRAVPAGGAAERGAHFDALRKSYPIRREFRFTEVDATRTLPALQRSIDGLGFRLTP